MIRRMEENIFWRDQRQIDFVWRNCEENPNDNRVTSLKILHILSYSKINSTLPCMMGGIGRVDELILRTNRTGLKKSVFNVDYDKN
jgi:hypothetical protein